MQVAKALAGRSILVTGAASGLGEAAARYFAEKGMNVSLLDMNAAKGAKVAESLSTRAQFVETDVSSEDSVKNAIAKHLEKFKALHGVVNCAGIISISKVLSKKGVFKLEAFAHTINVNLIGTFNVIRLATEVMAKNEVGADEDRGVIVNTASVAAYDGQIGQAAYAASKGGIVALTLPLAREFGAYKIRINTICPGIMDTEMMAKVPEPARKTLAAGVPYPSRFGLPGEFGALAYHLFENGYMNGESIRLDGALRMPPT